MRKSVVCLVLVLFSAALLAGCGAMAMSPVTGFLYTEIKGPLTATNNFKSSKVGTAKCTSVLGLVATGDASIEAAMKDGGITKIHYVDYNTKSILGIIAEFTVVVHGE